MKISMICFDPIESKYNGYFIRCYHIVNHYVCVMRGKK